MVLTTSHPQYRISRWRRAIALASETTAATISDMPPERLRAVDRRVLRTSIPSSPPIHGMVLRHHSGSCSPEFQMVSGRLGQTTPGSNFATLRAMARCRSRARGGADAIPLSPAGAARAGSQRPSRRLVRESDNICGLPPPGPTATNRRIAPRRSAIAACVAAARTSSPASNLIVSMPLAGARSSGRRAPHMPPPG